MLIFVKNREHCATIHIAVCIGHVVHSARLLFVLQLDGILSTKKYLTGDKLTEVDVGLYTILVRFDRVYYTKFKVRRLFK